MTVENYPKCRTCRHYEAESMGMCALITGSSTESRMESLEDDVTLFFVVNPDRFGCSLHSSLETDQQKGEG